MTHVTMRKQIKSAQTAHLTYLSNRKGKASRPCPHTGKLYQIIKLANHMQIKNGLHGQSMLDVHLHPCEENKNWFTGFPLVAIFRSFPPRVPAHCLGETISSA
mmetsp:Transcript_132782/g.234938  ORF Transcript_132782/g.234938 Transcript_132782/m.234938 type:complete len:103 (-) Transcript_132782:14-322(-)